LLVHVLEAFFGSELVLWCGQGVSLLVTDGSLGALATLEIHPVPVLPAVDGIPKALREQMGVNIDAPHGPLLLLGLTLGSIAESG
jgi:FtsP/CotA-like multicopper oxidase with cupredoxin domain